MTDLFALALKHPDVVKPPDRTGEARGWCPWHDDKSGSRKPTPNLGINVKKRRVKCWSCGAGGIKKLAAAWGLEAPARSRPGKAPDAFMSAEAAIEALRERYGLRTETLERFGIIADPKVSAPSRTTRGAYVYPTAVGKRFKAFDRTAKPKYWWQRGTDPERRRRTLYGLADAPPQAPVVYIVNGEPAVWVCRQAGIDAVCGFGEGQFPLSGAEALAQRAPGEVRLIPDLDATGERVAFRTMEALKAAGLKPEAYRLPHYLGDKGDVADLYVWHKRDDEALRQALEALPPFNPENPNPLAGSNYFVKQSKIWALRQTRHGEVEAPLTNFVAYARSETVVDDGVDQTLHLAMAGEMEGGRKLPDVLVPATEVHGLGWIAAKWGIGPIINAGASVRDQAREAIQRLSVGRGLPRRTVYSHTGWRKIHGQWRYLIPSDETDGDGADGADIAVELASNYERYHLPRRVQGTRDAVRASLRFLDVADHQITIPILAYMYLAPLQPMLASSFTLWLRARTGSFKSTLAALAMCHFGEFRYHTPPATWDASARGIERMVFDLKDCPAWVDDFAPKSTVQEQKELNAKAATVIRAVGNRQGRLRMAANTKSQPSLPPRGLLISTAEVYPVGDSVLSRILPIDFHAGMVDVDQLTYAQAEAADYRQAMKAYLDWLAPQYGELLKSLPAREQELRVSADLGAVHPRAQVSVSILLAASEVLCAFASSVGALSSAAAADLRAKTVEGLVSAGRRHAARIAEEDPVLRYLGIIDTLLAQNHVVFMPRGHDGEPPFNKELLGWYDADYVYMEPLAAYNQVSRWLNTEGRTIGLTEPGLRQALFEGGVAIMPAGETDKDRKHNTKRVQVNGRVHRVLIMPKDRLPFGEHFKHPSDGQGRYNI